MIESNTNDTSLDMKLESNRIFSAQISETNDEEVVNRVQMFRCLNCGFKQKSIIDSVNLK